MKPIDIYRDAVWAAAELDPLEKLLLQAMACWMDFDSLGNCRPGWTAITARTSMSRRTVGNKLKSCIKKKWLVCDFHAERPRPGQRREASVYRGRTPDWCTRCTSGECGCGDRLVHLVHRTSAGDAHHPLNNPRGAADDEGRGRLEEAS